MSHGSNGLSITRIEEMGLPYTIVMPVSPESQELFVNEVMPAFVA